MQNPDAVQRFFENVPLCQAMNMHVVTHEDDLPAVILPYDHELIGDTVTSVVHGGAVSVLLDTLCGAEVITHPLNSISTATINLRIDYLRSARPASDIYARAEVYHTTRHVAFVKGVAWDTNIDAPIAIATGAFTFSKKAPKS